MNQPEPGVFPRFYTEPVQDKRKSEEEGRPVFREVEMLEIITAGKRDPFKSKVKDHHIKRFPDAYKAFQEGKEQVIDGTPITEWAAISATQAASLKAQKIYTVEALVDLPDSRIGTIGMGARDLIAKAKAFLDVSADQKAAQKYAVENEKLRADIEMLKEQIQELGKKPKSKPKAVEESAA